MMLPSRHCSCGHPRQDIWWFIFTATAWTWACAEDSATYFGSSSACMCGFAARGFTFRHSHGSLTSGQVAGEHGAVNIHDHCW
ncbi:unnamed protein product [Symbiodinium sp. CCMP2592]|nr:unnamed protein product [Symbiodinium sp. CCMP2592]